MAVDVGTLRQLPGVEKLPVSRQTWSTEAPGWGFAPGLGSPPAPQTFSGDLRGQKGSLRDPLIRKGSFVYSVCKLSRWIPCPGRGPGSLGRDECGCCLCGVSSPEGKGVIRDLRRPQQRTTGWAAPTAESYSQPGGQESQVRVWAGWVPPKPKGESVPGSPPASRALLTIFGVPCPVGASPQSLPSSSRGVSFVCLSGYKFPLFIKTWSYWTRACPNDLILPWSSTKTLFPHKVTNKGPGG